MCKWAAQYIKRNVKFTKALQRIFSVILTSVKFYIGGYLFID